MSDDDLNDPLFWKRSGDDYFKEEKFSDAVRCYHEAIGLDPNNSSVWNNLGLTYVKLGMLDDAKKCKEQIKTLKGAPEQRKTPDAVQFSKGQEQPKPQPGLAAKIVAWIIIIVVFLALSVGIASFVFGIGGPDDQFKIAIKDSRNEITPHLTSMSTGFKQFDFITIYSECRELVPICTKYIDKIQSIQVSSKYQPSKQHFLNALTAIRNSCNQILAMQGEEDIYASLDRLESAKKYMTDASSEMDLATDLLPD